MFSFEIKVNGIWKAVNPPGGPPPYGFKTAAEAETMARIRYPKLMRLKAEGGEELIRVTSTEVS